MLKKIMNIFSKLLFLSAILLVFSVLFFIFYLGWDIYKTGLCTEYDSVKNYNQALNTSRSEEGIAHFPKTIPLNATDITFYFFSGGFYHQRMFLEFKTDESYINNELNNFKFIKGISPDNTTEWNAFYNMEQAKYDAKINTDKYTYYAINNERNNNLYQQKTFPYFSGIGVDKTNKKILYYYINPEG